MKLILLRHGQSEWNLANRFTGWVDVSLSENGLEEARQAGRKLKEADYHVDVVYTSTLRRAIQTAHYALNEMDQLWVEEYKHWRLNERHYGGLQGLDKAETAAKYGDEQVHIWRRSYDIKPPLLTDEQMEEFYSDPRFALMDDSLLPAAESLADTLDRALPYYFDYIVPSLKENKTVMVAAHGNSIRAITKHLEGLSDDEIVGVEIPTGVPIVYELDEHLNIVEKKVLD